MPTSSTFAPHHAPLVPAQSVPTQSMITFYHTQPASGPHPGATALGPHPGATAVTEGLPHHAILTLDPTGPTPGDAPALAPTEPQQLAPEEPDADHGMQPAAPTEEDATPTELNETGSLEVSTDTIPNQVTTVQLTDEEALIFRSATNGHLLAAPKVFFDAGRGIVGLTEERPEPQPSPESERIVFSDK